MSTHICSILKIFKKGIKQTKILAFGQLTFQLDRQQKINLTNKLHTTLEKKSNILKNIESVYEGIGWNFKGGDQGSPH